MDNRRVAARSVFLLPAGAAMFAGLDGALLLLGLPAPVDLQRLPDVHGPVMVLGFVGTVVALERAVAVGRRAGYASPLLLGAGGLALVSPLPRVVGQTALLLGALALVWLYTRVWRRQPAAAVAVQATGAALAVAAAGLWTSGVAVPHLVPCLAGFLVLTIAGERLELLRVAAPPRGVEDAVLVLAQAWCVAAVLALLWPAVGYPLLGAVLLTLVGVLVRHDVARRTVRAAGLPRFMAVAMLAGYVWLAVAGAVWLAGGPVLSGGGYDAVLHSVFLGFVMSMIMAHAPVILPAVVRRPLPYHPVMYTPLAVLHVTLALRVLVGDAHDVPIAVQVGGVGNIVALLGFMVVAAVSVARAGRRGPDRPGPRPRVVDPEPARPAGPAAVATTIGLRP
ncbi:hypothetical protein ACGIF2_02420 [Cellulomonas sp. P22]|uniref:hypothetical protein n=1 Tax=Cellulomonas sp. P22 TaxID=3373189 RepID=UPI00378F91F8